MDLLFGGVEGKVADVEGGCVFELVFGRGGAAAVIVTSVAVASALLEESQSLHTNAMCCSLPYLCCRIRTRLVEAVNGTAKRRHDARPQLRCRLDL